jgi:hypothetical protein
MFVPSERFQLLARQFVTLEQSLHESPSLEERAQLLRRMKIVIAQMDNLILPTLEEWMQNPTASPRRPTIGLD